MPEFESLLARLAAAAPLHAMLDLDIETARAAWHASAARAAPLSPVDGLTIAVKANIAVAGLPWHGGIAAYRDHRASADAPVVARLRAAGAVILGIANMHEAGLGGSTENPAFGTCRNPHFPDLSPGGSSGGGAAAVAAGLCDAALGTDTLGSVRIPAAYCGLFGHKPAAGTLPSAGVMPLSSTLDTVGIQAGSAALCAAVLQVLAPFTPAAPASCAVLDLTDAATIDPAIAAALAAAADRARALGLDVRPLRLPGLTLPAWRRAGLLIAEAEAAQYHRTRLATCPEGFSPHLRAMLAWGAAQPPAKIAAARRLIAEAATTLREAAATADILLLPTTPTAPFALGLTPPPDQADLTTPANLAGLAATAFPAGRDSEGRPLSLQALSATNGLSLTAAGLLAIGAAPV